MSDVTQILSQIDSGNPSAAEQRLPLVYDELRRLAAHRLAQGEDGFLDRGDVDDAVATIDAPIAEGPGATIRRTWMK